MTNTLLVANLVMSTAALALSGVAFYGLVKGKKKIEEQLNAALARAERVTKQAKRFVAAVSEELAN